MEQIISNPAFDFISEQIVLDLDCKSISALAAVSQDFRDFININIKSIYLNRLKKVKQIVEEDEILVQMCAHVEQFDTPGIKNFVDFMQNCVESSEVSVNLDNLLEFCRTKEDFQSLDSLLELLKTVDYEEAFWMACCFERIEFVNSMNIQTIDINQTWNNGTTPLMFACEEGLIQTVNFFLGLPGIKVNAKDDFGMTALDSARESGQIEIVNLIVSTLFRTEIKLSDWDCAPGNDFNTFAFQVMNAM